MMNQDSNRSTANNHPTLATGCGHCGVEERKFLHNVRLRGNFRRLCTTCVLRLHPQCFCPACLGVYDRTPPDDAVVCYKCYSSSHPNCVSTPPTGAIASSRGPSPCSTCVNPNALVLNLKRVDNGRVVGRAIDNNAARLLLAAGKIASLSMKKAEAAAATEAERRAKEAAYTKKRAREALDHVVYLMGKEKSNVVDGNKKFSTATNNVVPMPMPMPVAVAVDASNVNNKVDTSNEVLEAFNAVELKERARPPQGFSAGSEAQGNGDVVMEVDAGNGKDSGVNSVADNGSGKTDHLGKGAQGDIICTDLVPVSQDQNLEKIHAMEEGKH